MGDWYTGTFAAAEPSYAPMRCCLCGDVVAKPTASRMCHLCISKNVNLSQEVATHCTILQCGTCKKFFHDRWLNCEMESRELLSICLKKVKGLDAMKIINASFVFTEHHSKQLKVKICVQKEVDNSFVVEQTFVIDFAIRSSQCDYCKRMYTPHTWKAMVQIRQKTKDKRHILMLEQVIIKHNAHENVSSILSRRNGFDLHFQSKTCAQKFADFISDKIVSQVKNSKKLITQDSVNNKWDYKYTLQVTLIPICADDLVFLPPKVASMNGGVSPFMLCVNLTTTISLIDPFTLRTLEVSGDKYWKNPFSSREFSSPNAAHQIVPVFTKFNLCNFIILNVEKDRESKNTHPYYELVDVEIMAVNSSTVIYTKSHLGKALAVGDTFSGYDIRRINMNGLAEEETDITNKIPFDVILVRKVKNKRAFKTNWVLKRIVQTKGGESDDEIEEDELLDFKEELMNKKELQRNVDFYQNPKMQVSKDGSAEGGELDVLASQLKELSLQDTNYF
ncbi:nonsense-mediated mRNA decay protein, putative [Babesia bigemina]|uniref:60S ribosomal export protein NMD3 n=1 Tax=Babesia bigemina TaxID=5866 RepID=A0A061D2T4_BABBI|nr:nonsense-mediated mRNA decay protein, putative [Babesia bigemina]CDR94387.1 nonsense-mediated mRNA decay protein, putative [Babesia bigemina]|eukprot:XP_012766573.1 nonsense-mediated mRNA decay protein, putative [Babesia bigemina]